MAGVRQVLGFLLAAPLRSKWEMGISEWVLAVRRRTALKPVCLEAVLLASKKCKKHIRLPAVGIAPHGFFKPLVTG